MRLAEIGEVAAASGNDPALDGLLIRLHVETACRRSGALAMALRPKDLDVEQCLILLREKSGSFRIDQSPDSNAIEHLLEQAIDVVPHLLLKGIQLAVRQ